MPSVVHAEGVVNSAVHVEGVVAMHCVSDVNLSPPFEGADLSACTICGIPFRPPRGEECHGKCEDCLNAHFHNFARQHVPVLFSHFVHDVLSPPLHDAQPPGVATETGGAMGTPPSKLALQTAALRARIRI